MKLDIVILNSAFSKASSHFVFSKTLSNLALFRTSAMNFPTQTAISQPTTKTTIAPINLGTKFRKPSQSPPKESESIADQS